MRSGTFGELAEAFRRGDVNLPRSVVWPPPLGAGRKTMKLETMEELRKALDLSTLALERQLKINQEFEARIASLTGDLAAARAQAALFQQARDTWIEAAVARVHERDALLAHLKVLEHLVANRPLIDPDNTVPVARWILDLGDLVKRARADIAKMATVVERDE
jgi:cell division septum initiation protein DivIVA